MCLGAFKSGAQVVFLTEKKKEAQVKIFQTQYKLEADVVVFKTPFIDNAVENKGIWFFTKHEGECNKIITYTKEKQLADLKVYFTSDKNEAGWINKKKKYIMN